MLAIGTPDTLKAATTIAAALDRQTAAIDRLNYTLATIGLLMDDALEKLRVQIEATTTVQASAVQLIQKVVEELRSHAGEADKINALADSLAAATQPLADAVAANTQAQ